MAWVFNKVMFCSVAIAKKLLVQVARFTPKGVFIHDVRTESVSTRNDDFSDAFVLGNAVRSNGVVD